MAITTPASAAVRARRTTVALKLLMAVTGALFVLFVLAHMYGNLKLIVGQEAFDEYAEHLREFGEPILPREGFLWIFRITLLLALVGHAYSAFALWARAGKARTTRYAVRTAGKAALQSQMMRWGGVTLLVFLVWHLLHFTIAKVNINGDVSDAEIGDSPYALVVASFQVWWMVVIYLVALVALGIHLHHGVWSAAQTLGLTNTPTARRNAKALAGLIGLVTTVGFALPPVLVLVGVIE